MIRSTRSSNHDAINFPQIPIATPDPTHSICGTATPSKWSSDRHSTGNSQTQPNNLAMPFQKMRRTRFSLLRRRRGQITSKLIHFTVSTSARCVDYKDVPFCHYGFVVSVEFNDGSLFSFDIVFANFARIAFCCAMGWNLSV